ncbi:unnamed protein product [Adineta ricciae]|uniref:Uncharacterized protein n=1 Tax=Adineta ricciae TaxID=249248 RepID=A0A816C1H8_ADIRI|nr:unnamed protein product [Adineta ricciae]
MKIFDFPSFHITTNKHLFPENTLFSFGQDRSLILKWVNNLLNKILNTTTSYVKDFYMKTWSDCSYMSLIMKYLCPISLKYGTLEYFDHLKAIEQVEEEKLELYINLSNYCFQTTTIVDYRDQTEKSLFRFFSELKQNVLFILKSNQIGKLVKTNPYTKQLFESVLETTNIEQIEFDNKDEDYLVFDENKYQNETQRDNLDMKHSLHDEQEYSPIDLPKEQPILTQNLSEILSSITDECQSGLRSRKPRRKRSIVSSATPVPSGDKVLQILELLRDPKLLIFKYLFVLASSKFLPSSSRRNHFEPCSDNHSTTILQPSKAHHITRSVAQKDKNGNTNLSPSKPESGSEEVHTAPSHHERTKTSSPRSRLGRSDCIGQDADEESTVACTRMTKTRTSLNNSANQLQQQAMGDHHAISKHHRSRKHHRFFEQQDQDLPFDQTNTYRSQLTTYLILILILAFVLYRFLLAVWPKPKKTFLEQLIDDLSTVFTP